MTQRDDAEFQPHLDAAFGALLNDIADHEGHDTLGLIILDDLHDIGGIVRLAEHDGDAGDIARDERDTEGTDDGVGDKADAGVGFIGVAALDILQALEDLRADGGGKTSVERLSEILLIGDKALENADAGGQIAELGDLHAGGGIDGGEEIRSVGERDGLVSAVLCNGVIDGALGQTGDGIRAAIDEIG